MGILQFIRGMSSTTDGRLIVRAGSTNRALIGQELLRFVTSKSSEPAEDRRVRGVTLDDLDNDRARSFISARLRRRRFDLKAELADLGFLTPDGHVRLCALLLFGKTPQHHTRRLGRDRDRESRHAAGLGHRRESRRRPVQPESADHGCVPCPSPCGRGRHGGSTRS